MKIVNCKLKTDRAYTLIELLIVIAIISILIGVLIPTITRSLTKNKLASDVDVMRAKIEDTRLLAGSTQTNDTLQGADSPGFTRVGYYGLFIPTQSDIGSGKPFYAIVRLSKPLTDSDLGFCSAQTAVAQAKAGSGSCLIERIDLTTDVSYDPGSIIQERIIAFSVPSQQIMELQQQPVGWVENAAGPRFDQSPYFVLKYRDKTASISVEAFTGKLLVTYN